MVMERYKIPEQQAFAFLTRLSQDDNIKIRQIADQTIHAITAEVSPPQPLAKPTQKRHIRT